MSDDEYPRIAVDRSENSPETGETRERTLVSPVQTLDTSNRGRRATFSYNPETETYSLESYEGVKLKSRGWRKSLLVFQPRDIDVLEFMGEHLKRSDGGATVTPFGGEARVVDDGM